MRTICFLFLFILSCSGKQDSLNVVDSNTSNYTEVKFSVPDGALIPDTFAKFPEGNSGVMKYFSDNINIQDTSIHGRVVVRFVIDTNGYVQDIKILNGISNIIDNEIVRVMDSMPKWEPARKDGKPVSIEYLQPLRFWLMKIIFLLCLIIVSFFSCNQKSLDKNIESLEKILPNGLLSENQLNVCVIPTNGCDGCVSKLVAFAISQEYDSNTFFVLTGKSLKQIILSSNFSGNNSNIYIDSAGILLENQLVNDFPILYKIQGGIVVKQLELNGHNIDSVAASLYREK